MAISAVGGSSAAATTITIPAGHQPGDLLVMFAFNSANTTVPTLPAGWTNILSNAGNACVYLLAYRVATSVAETSGTWTTATGLVCHVYRGVAANQVPVGGHTSSQGTSTSVSYTALATANMSSWVAGFMGHKTATNVDVAPTGMVLRAGTAVGGLGGSDTNTGTAGWSTTAVTVNASAGWTGVTLEILNNPLSFNNYEFVKVGDGMSSSEKIR